MADIIKASTRDGYGNALLELGKTDEKVIVMDADLAGATKTGVFKKAFPEKFFNAGIAESNLMGVAAGLSLSGYTVFASTFAMFAAGRAFEQVRNSIGYPKLNVKIAATHAGISVGEDGASHQCCEDIALMRTIPEMVIINPADDVEAKAATIAASKYEGPVYLRFGRLAVPRIFEEESYNFEWGKGKKLKDGTDVTIVATGLMVHEALKAAERLEVEGISARVINIHTIKPLDRHIIMEAAYETGAIVTAEEHNVIGGLGGAVSELVCENHPVPVLKVGVNDVFGRSGPALELLDLYNLNCTHIAEKAKQAVAFKIVPQIKEHDLE
ncbi:MAG: transketolase family protein [Acutalibacteraceae bacterium]|nr:transketolase family protein [Clostridiales bacterium]